MTVEGLLAAGGGLDEEGVLRLPGRLWALLEDAPRALIYAGDRVTVVGEIRLVPGGAGVYHADGGYSLLSPEEVEDVLRSTAVVL